MHASNDSPPACFGRAHRGGPCGPDCTHLRPNRSSQYRRNAAQYLKELESLRAAALHLIADVDAHGQPRPEVERLFEETLLRYREREREFVATQRVGDRQVA